MPITSCYAITAVITSPLLYFMFVRGYYRGFFFSPWLFSADLMGLFIPTPMNELGVLHFFADFPDVSQRLRRERRLYRPTLADHCVLMLVRTGGAHTGG